MNTLALYYRASNEDESLDESATIQNQRDLLHCYIQSQREFTGWRVLEFQDDGWSGTTFHRPGIQKILHLAGNEIQCIVVKDLSRFGRNLIGVGHYLDQVFPFLGVRFIAVNEGYDSKNNIGRAVGLDVSLKAMVSELYSRDLSKKISSVKEAQIKIGRYIGSFAFYGYQRSKTTKSGLEIDPEAADTIRRIFSLAAAGVNTLQIAVLLNEEGILSPLDYRRRKNPDERYLCPTAIKHSVWTQGRIAAVIRDERYTGVLVGKKRRRVDITTKKEKLMDKGDWIRVENAIDAIVSRAEFEQAQMIFLRRRKRGAVMAKDLFRGLLKCGQCGKALDKILSKNVYYRCAAGKWEPTTPCARIRVERRELEQAILSCLKCQVQLLPNGPLPHETVKQENAVSRRLKIVENEMRKCKSRQVILFEQLSDGVLKKEQFILEKQKIAKQLSEFQAERDSFLRLLQSENQSKKMQNSSIEDLSRKLLTELVEKIRIWPEHGMEIIWKFPDSALR